MTLFTGKLPATTDKRSLWFHNYVDTSVIDLNNPPPAKALGHGTQMPSPRLMLGNGPDNSVAPGFQGAGDCVFACITNYQRLAWALGGKGLFPATGKTAIGNYSEVTGYILNDPSTDQGTNMLTAMNWWRKTGYKDANGARRTIGGFAPIKISNFNHLLWACYLSDEGVPLGIQFPDSGMTQFGEDKPWTVVKGSGIDGGHAILLDLDTNDASTGTVLKVESWARDQETDKAFLTKYVDEAYFVVDNDGFVNGKSLEGFDSQQLLADAGQFS